MVRVEAGACLQASVRRCAELADARVHKVLLVGGSQRGDELVLGPDKPFQPFVESPVCRYVLVARQLVGSVPRYQLPPVVVESTDLPGDAGSPCGTLSSIPAPPSTQPRVFQYRASSPGSLEDVALKDMGGAADL